MMSLRLPFKTRQKVNGGLIRLVFAGVAQTLQNRVMVAAKARIGQFVAQQNAPDHALVCNVQHHRFDADGGIGRAVQHFDHVAACVVRIEQLRGVPLDRGAVLRHGADGQASKDSRKFPERRKGRV